MAPLSLKIVLDEGAVTRTVKFDSGTTVAEAHSIIKEKILTGDDGKEYGLFLTSADNPLTGIWLEARRPLDYYMLRDGDSLLYINHTRMLRVRMLDGSLKTLQVDESKNIAELMFNICSRIGITNHDEYGLCHEEVMEEEESKENKPATGTLTLKRKAQQKEKDAKMAELSKKLKSDDNVEWLDQHKTLRELGVDPKKTVLLKRRLFYSDRNVDSRDPVQLNLLYVQTRDAILNGRHPVTEDQAMEFAAIQCQIHFGDFNDEKHKPGLIENLREYLPEQYFNSWGAEKKILKLYRKHQGLAQLEAKLLYTKTARDLPTYGVTFFVVKEKQKGKKKMVPRLLGINSESILRLDEVTKEILQVWPLTHVKTYHVGKHDTFTLDFGDYSDKEYCVKTNDAHRIRDILEGYIDIIRRRLCGPFNAHAADSGVIGEDNVNASRGNTMTHVVHNASKVVEQSFVGPSQILPFEQGSKASSGTQMMTVQQVIVTNKGSTQQQVISGEVPLRSDMSLGFVKKLNGMNANAVKIVTLLTEPNAESKKEVQRLMTIMEENMEDIRNGMNEAAAKQTSEDARKQLETYLEALCQLMDDVSRNAKSENMDPEKLQESSRKIADLTTQIYFSLDPGTRRRSEFCRRSRKSFIQDEKTEKTLRRASFIASAASAMNTIDSTLQNLNTREERAPLSQQEIERLELSAGDKLSKLNAAVALFLIAYSDTENIDYAAAVNSMNTIKELSPEFVADAKVLSEALDGESRRELLDDLETWCNTVKDICLPEHWNDQKLLEKSALGYAEVSGRLVYVFGGRNPKVNADKENEITELAKQVGDKTTVLLMQANELAAAADDTDGEAAELVDRAGGRCADRARDLISCAMLTAPTIHEPHCQSALTSSIESLSSAVQQLALAWRPLVEPPHKHATGENLTTATMDLARALDCLRNAYANLGNDADMQEANAEVSPEEGRRLRFVAAVGAARAAVRGAAGGLGEPIPPSTLSNAQAVDLQDSVSQKMAQVNASVASLLRAKHDPENPDYETADLAVTTISEVIPTAIKDCRALISTCDDERVQRAMINDIRTWCDAIDSVCASSAAGNQQELDEATKKFSQASKRLSFIFSPHARSARERLMLELFESAQKQAERMVDDTNAMADTMGGASGGRLRDLGRAVKDSARSLHTTLLVAGPTLQESRCRSAVSECSDSLALATQRLAESAEQLRDDETGCRLLAAKLQAQRAKITKDAHELNEALRAIKEVLHEPVMVTQVVESPVQKSQRLKFVASASAVQEKAKNAETILQQPVGNVKLNEQQTREMESKMAQRLAEVNSAIASLIHAKTNRQNPNYEAADQAIETVADLLPQIINESKILSTTCKDDATRQATLKDIQAWCDAIQMVCAHAGEHEIKDFVDSAQEFADVSNRLCFVFSPRKISPTEQQILVESKKACTAAHAMVDHCSTADDEHVVPRAIAAELRERRARLRDTAYALKTTAQLTAPNLSDATSRATLQSSADALGGAAGDLVHHCSHVQDLSQKLQPHHRDLNDAVTAIKNTCHGLDSGAVENPAIKAQRMKYIASTATVQEKLKAAEKSLDQPSNAAHLDDQHVKEIEKKLSREVARVNAAVAMLLHAKSDAQNPDYLTAEHSISTISELVPIIVADTKILSSACKDERSKEEKVKEMRDWLHATGKLCDVAKEGSAEEFDKAVQNFTNTSNKLKFIASSRRDPAKEQEVLRASNNACQKAQQMVSETRRVCVSPSAASVLQRAQILDVVAHALARTAQLTAPSITDHHSKSALLPAADSLSQSAKQLVCESQRCNAPGIALLTEQLKGYEKELEQAVDRLKDTCANNRASVATLNAQRLKFATSAAAVQDKAKEAEQLLVIPTDDVKLTDQQTKEIQNTVSGVMAEINAALAALIYAKSDTQNPDYESAEKSLQTISEFMPDVINGTRALSTTCKEEAVRQGMLNDIRLWCDAIQKVCASASESDNKDLHESAMDFSNVSQKLRFIVSARKSPVKEQQIMQLSATACDKAQQMSSESRTAARSVPAAVQRELDARAAALDDAATALKTTAQLTAPCLRSAVCQSALLSAADSVSSRGRELVRSTSQQPHPALTRLAEELDRYRDLMDKALAGLRHTVNTLERRSSGPPPPVPIKRSSGSRRSSTTPLQSPRVRIVSHSDTRRASQEWLDNMRLDASRDLSNGNDDLAVLTKAAEEHKRKHERFAASVKQAEIDIQQAEDEVNKAYNSIPNVPVLNEDQREAIQNQMEQKLSLANNAAAKLLVSNHPDNLDYTTASQSVEMLSEMVSDIVKDGVLLATTEQEPKRRALLDKILALCQSSRRLVVRASSDDIRDVNEAAVTYGDATAALVYDVCKTIDPAQEKEIVSRSKEAVAGASLLAAGAGGAGRSVRAAGVLAAAAGRLLYTAKLLGPSIHHQQCQNTLVTASHELSSELKKFTAANKHHATDPQGTKYATEVAAEAAQLEKLLEAYRQDLVAGKMVKRRQVEKVVVEDTVLRQLAMQIMLGAQGRAECTSVPQNKKEEFVKYANTLRDAIRALDVANHRCKRAPHDLNRRQELENAVQNLQMITLQSRPTLGNRPQNNIVDLTDFVKETSTESKQLLEATAKTKSEESMKELDVIKEECQRINSNASKLLNPDSSEDLFDDVIMGVDHFGQDTDNRLRRIKSTLEGINEKKVKHNIQEKLHPLEESCNLLRFASKSAVATAQSAALDETLNDLNDLENRLDKLLVPAEGATTCKPVDPRGVRQSCVRVQRAAGAVCAGRGQRVAALLTAHVHALRAAAPSHDAHHTNKMKEHASRLIQLMRILTAATSTRVAMWQPIACPEIAEILQQIAKELENVPFVQTDGNEATSKILNEAGINKLLMPLDGVEEGANISRVPLQQCAGKVMSVCGTVLSAPAPAALARTASAAVNAARDLAENAVRAHPQNSPHRKRAEEAGQEMCWSMYGLLRSAEELAQRTDDVAARRRTHHAAKLLADAVDRLSRTSPDAASSQLSNRCAGAERSLRLHAALSLCGAQPAPAPPYLHCVRALQDQRELIHKLKVDEPQSRQQFAESMEYVASAVCNSSEYAVQTAYLISISEQHKEMAKEGLIDVTRLEKLSAAVQDSCFRIIRATNVELVKDEAPEIQKLTQELHQAVKDASSLTTDANTKRELTECAFKIGLAAKNLSQAIGDTNDKMDKICSSAISLSDCISSLHSTLERPTVLPAVGAVSAQTKAMADDILAANDKLIRTTQSLVAQVKSVGDDDAPMTWVTYTQRDAVLDAFDALLGKIQRNGEQAGLVEPSRVEVYGEPDAPKKKTYLQTQEQIVCKWLQRRPSQPEVQREGEEALRNIIDVATKVTEDLKGSEKEELQTLIDECQELLAECSKKYDNDTARSLAECVRATVRAVQRAAVTRAVDDALLPPPLHDLQLLLDALSDEKQRKFLLEKKIAELMSQLGRVTRTARLMAHAANPKQDLERCTTQAELLAPNLVKAAEERVSRPNDQTVVDKYKALLAQYTECINAVRDQCDRAVDPLLYAQTAGETMARMREESTHNDPQLCAYTYGAITRLARRVLEVSMCSELAQDGEVRAALAEARARLDAAADARASQLPNFNDNTAEMLRTTGEVESALGGENIFKKLPEPDQPIYTAALNLHAAVRGWSTRDNEIVAVAKRMAVLMARLSEQMHTERKRELLATSKAIVIESRDVAALAKKLANECADVRIRTNLLQVCERIPTISGQLKMLTTVKGSSLGNQGGEEDREAMNMLVCNAQNLMSSVQEVVKAAASASVKIASQRGLKWVRKTY